MSKTSLITTLAIIIIGGGIWLVVVKDKWDNPEPTPMPQEQVFDGRNSTFVVDGKIVTLVNGTSETPGAPGSTATIMTRYFGNEAKGDLTGDGLEDIAFLITQETGGSG